MENTNIYLDSASTTKVDEKVVTEMLPYFSHNYGNPNSLHKIGRMSHQAIEGARKLIANDLNCSPGNVFFTGSGSEANNWALKGFAYANRDKGNHIIISSIEHDSLLESAHFLKKNGFTISFVKPDKSGHINPKEVEKLITSKTILISVMAVNNETGCIQPIEDIANLAHKYKVAYHVDFVQALSLFKPDIKNIKADLLSLSSHKIHGPKGIGVLYIKSKTKIYDLIDGGSQEFSKRGGTSNTPIIVGFGKAVELNAQSRDLKTTKYEDLSKSLIKYLSNHNVNFKINGESPKVSNILNITFNDIDAEGLLHILDDKGVYISIGSACNSSNKRRSHVLKSMGLDNKAIDSSVRISFDDLITIEQLNSAAKIISETITQIKKMKGKI